MASTKVAQRSAGTAPAEAPDVKEGEVKEGDREQGPHRRTATVNLPFVTAEFRAPDLHLPSLPVRAPDRSDLTGAVSAIRSRLPSPAQAVYYAGLGVLGVLELLEWPVVLAVGVGTALVQYQCSPNQGPGQQGGGAPEHTEPAPPSAPGQRSGKSATAQQ